MRRTLLLSTFAAVGVALVAITTPPPRRTGRELVHGPRPFQIAAQQVQRIEVDAATRRVVAERAGAGWRVDATLASPALHEALDALVGELAGLRAVDAFRPTDPAALGLDPPAATIVITTARGTQRLQMGSLNAAGSTFYARRDGHARVLQLGVYVLELIRRVIDARDARSDEAREPRGYWPEMG